PPCGGRAGRAWRRWSSARRRGSRRFHVARPLEGSEPGGSRLGRSVPTRLPRRARARSVTFDGCPTVSMTTQRSSEGVEDGQTHFRGASSNPSPEGTSSPAHDWVAGIDGGHRPRRGASSPTAAPAEHRTQLPARDGWTAVLRITPQLRAAMLAVSDELSVDGGGDRLATESLANLLAVHLIRNASALRPPARRTDSALPRTKLRAVLEYTDKS